MNTIRTTIENFYNEIRNIVGENVEMNICHSSTDFGNSSYLYVGPFKVRHSDHSTGTSRVLSELHLSSLTKRSIVETIERYYFPERYETVNVLSWGGVHEATDKKISGLKFEYEIVKENIKTSKSGNVIHMIRVRNVEKTLFVRK